MKTQQYRYDYLVGDPQNPHAHYTDYHEHLLGTTQVTRRVEQIRKIHAQRVEVSHTAVRVYPPEA